MLTTFVAVLATMLAAEPEYKCNELRTEKVFDADSCTIRGHTLRILLLQPPNPDAAGDSPSCAGPDELRLVLEHGGHRVEVPYPGYSPTWWWKLDTMPSALPAHQAGAGLCRRVAAVSVGTDEVLLLFYADDRPTNERVVGVLFDLGKDKVVEARALEHGTAVKLGAHAAWYRQAELGQCGGQFIQTPEDQLLLPSGDRLVSLPDCDGFLNPVRKVNVSKGRILDEPDLGPTYASFRNYFSTQDAFVRAVGWGTGRSRSKVREGTSAQGRTCIQLHADEPGGAWRTLPFYCERSQ